MITVNSRDQDRDMALLVTLMITVNSSGQGRALIMMYTPGIKGAVSPISQQRGLWLLSKSNPFSLSNYQVFFSAHITVYVYC